MEGSRSITREKIKCYCWACSGLANDTSRITSPRVVKGLMIGFAGYLTTVTVSQQSTQVYNFYGHGLHLLSTQMNHTEMRLRSIGKHCLSPPYLCSNLPFPPYPYFSTSEDMWNPVPEVPQLQQSYMRSVNDRNNLLYLPKCQHART